MRVLAVSFSVFLFAALVSAQYQYDTDFYLMADDDLDFDGFDISGGAAQLPYSLPNMQQLPELSQAYQSPAYQPPQYQSTYPSAPSAKKGPMILPVQTLPMQTSSSAPITLPLQRSTREMVTLPVITKAREGINAAPVVHTQYIEQPLKQYRLVNQEFIQPRLIETPKMQKTHYTQPVYRQIVTQPVVVPRITNRDIIHQRFVDQPIYQHRLIQSSTLQPNMVDVPVTNAPQQQAPIQMPAGEPIIQRENVQANPIYRTAPTITQPTVTQPIQMPPPSLKKAQQTQTAYTQNNQLPFANAGPSNDAAGGADSGEY